jgi:hypothetical protein
MTPQERDLLIASAMGIKLHYNEYLKSYFVEGDDLYCKWNPSENAKQEKMIKAKLREWGIGYSSGYNLFNDGNRSDKFHFTIRDLDEIVFDTDHITKRSTSEPEAFLEAVGELCVELKKQK